MADKISKNDKLGYPFSDTYHSTFLRHPEGVSPKDLLFKFYKNYLFLTQGILLSKYNIKYNQYTITIGGFNESFNSRRW
jgi:hypothetical protein